MRWPLAEKKYFKVLRGKYVHGKETIKSPDTGIESEKQMVFVKGDVVPTELDLLKMFGPEKFAPASPPRSALKRMEQEGQASPTIALPDGFKEMTGTELKSFAYDHGIELRGVVKVDDMRKAIEAAVTKQNAPQTPPKKS